jgi:hypothetical protein
MSRLSRSTSAVSCLGCSRWSSSSRGHGAVALPRPSPSPIAVASPAEASASPTGARPRHGSSAHPGRPRRGLSDRRNLDRVDDVVAVLGGESQPRSWSWSRRRGRHSIISPASGLGGHLRWAPTVDALAADLRADASRLGFVRASEVGPSIRALGWEGRFLFGVKRVRSLADWPLAVPLAASEGTEAFVLARTWTIVAAGVVMLDRGVYNAVVNGRRGVNYPSAAAMAAITSRYCRSPFGWSRRARGATRPWPCETSGRRRRRCSRQPEDRRRSSPPTTRRQASPSTGPSRRSSGPA